ncbi:anoctamin-5 isoform X4 [Halyomorpha halys]|uniref:anoctamin-5 isoform X4 n=1 Tax=Halyomorpha halys TaxID=286706 RepID=UPI000D0C7A92|nr:anoctamin-5-like isoform X4 [Halyomorpha halys]
MHMESSQEEIYTESLPSDHDSIRLSRFTIYHSAPDLPDAVAEQTTLFIKNSKNPTPQVAKSIMFNDDRRSVDFVLAWLDGKQSNEVAEEKRALFEANLQEEGIEIEREQTDKLHVVKLHVPKDVLRRYSEILRLRMPMKETPQDRLFGSNFDLITEVKSFFSKLISCVRLDPSVFPKEKFRLSAEYNRHKTYLFDEDDVNFFSSQVRTLVLDFILSRTSFDAPQKEANNKANFGIEKLINDGVYKAAYPLHDGEPDDSTCLRGKLFYEWAHVNKWAMFQPIDHIREYFGVKFALYFAWLGFYTHMLIPASIVGLLCFVYGILTLGADQLSTDICDESLNIIMCPLCDKTCDYWKLSDTCTFAKVTYLFDNPVTIVFAVFMSFWATLFLELWKRYSASIAHRWGLTDFNILSEPPRPQYMARFDENNPKKSKTNVITGVKEPYVPFWTVKVPATLFSFSIVIVLVLLAVAAVFGVVLYRMSVLASISIYADRDWAANYALIIIPATAAVLNLAFILVLNYIYDKLAVYLTELEMHRTQTEFDESLTIKIYLFQFVNYYTSIMYIAFLKGKVVGYPAKYNRIFGLRQEECNPGGCLMELCIQLAIIMVGQQFLNGILEMLIPFICKWINSLSIKAGLEKPSNSEVDAVVDDPSHKRWTEDFKLLDWGPRGLFGEYLEMVLQYGFVTIFVTAFPLAPFFALVNNIFEMRLDARKFLLYYRRPVPKRAPNIGVWFRILNVLGRLAVISNAFIIAFSSNFIPKMVYMYELKTNSYAGFLNHSLSVFDTKDFEPGSAPIYSSFNTSICRYAGYRNPPGPDEYRHTALYWHILAARLAFIVIFQNLVSTVVNAIQWCIPDIPSDLRDQIKREAYLTNELIIEYETQQAKQPYGAGDASVVMLNYEKEDEIRKRTANSIHLDLDQPR